MKELTHLLSCSICSTCVPANLLAWISATSSSVLASLLKLGLCIGLT